MDLTLQLPNVDHVAWKDREPRGMNCQQPETYKSARKLWLAEEPQRMAEPVIVRSMDDMPAWAVERQAKQARSREFYGQHPDLSMSRRVQRLTEPSTGTRVVSKRTRCHVSQVDAWRKTLPAVSGTGIVSTTEPDTDGTVTAIASWGGPCPAEVRERFVADPAWDCLTYPPDDGNHGILRREAGERTFTRIPLPVPAGKPATRKPAKPRKVEGCVICHDPLSQGTAVDYGPRRAHERCRGMAAAIDRGEPEPEPEPVVVTTETGRNIWVGPGRIQARMTVTVGGYVLTLPDGQTVQRTSSRPYRYAALATDGNDWHVVRFARTRRSARNGEMQAREHGARETHVVALDA